MQSWEEISWVEGNLLGQEKSSWLEQCLLFGPAPAHVTSHALQPSLVSPWSPECCFPEAVCWWVLPDTGAQAQAASEITSASWGRCAVVCPASAARAPLQLLGPSGALPPCLPRFPSWGKQDISGGGGEWSMPPAHPDTEMTNTNMPFHTGSTSGSHNVRTYSSAEPREKAGRWCSSIRHLYYSLRLVVETSPFLFSSHSKVLNNWLPSLSNWWFVECSPSVC